MNNNEVDISQLCRIIKDSVGDAVKKAVDSPEVWEIKQTVKSVAQEVADELQSHAGMSKGAARRRTVHTPPHGNGHYANGGRQTYVYNTPGAADNKQQEPPVQQTQSGPPVWRGNTGFMRFKGVALSVIGSAGVVAGAGVLAGVALMSLRMVTDVVSMVAAGLFSLIPIGMIVAFVMLATRGTRLSGMARRYPRYLKTIGDDRFCPIKVLAESSRKNERFVVKDISRMIKAGLFPEGRLDESKQTLILDEDTYRHYQEAQRKMEEQRANEAAKKTPEQQTEEEKLLAEGKEYIRRMRLANDLIEGEEISEKIDRIEKVGMRIFEHVEQHPEKLPEIRKLMSYYLPITIKLLEGYAKFDNQPVQGDNIKAAKKEIEDTLDTINIAFENLLDSLFRSDMMDISSDISALEAMLAQEGLTGSDFDSQ